MSKVDIEVTNENILSLANECSFVLVYCEKINQFFNVPKDEINLRLKIFHMLDPDDIDLSTTRVFLEGKRKYMVIGFKH